MSQISVEFAANAQPLLGAIERINTSVKRLQGAFAGVSIGLAAVPQITQLVTGAFSQLNATVNQGAGLAQLSRATGQSAGELVTLQRAFKVAGLDAANLPAALRGVAKALAGVNEDGDPTNATLKRLGVNVDNLKTQGAVEQFRTLAVAIMALPSPAERLAAVQKVFGKAGADLMPLLQDFADAPTFEKLVRSSAELAAFVDKNAEGFRVLKRDMAGAESKFDQFQSSMARGFITGQSEAGKLTEKTEGFFKTLNSVNLNAVGLALGARFSKGLDAFVTKSPGALALRPLISPLLAAGSKEQSAAEAEARAKTLEKMLAGVASEADRTNAHRGLDRMREALSGQIKGAGAGQGEMIDGWMRQVDAIETARRMLAGIPPEILKAKQEQREFEAATLATAAAATLARERIETAPANIAAKEKQIALAGMKPAEQRQAILGELGQGPRFTAADLDRQIGGHEAARQSYNLEPEQEIYYAKLLDVKERLLSLNQAIAVQEKAAFREIEEAQKHAARENLRPEAHRGAILKEAGTRDERGFNAELAGLQRRDPNTLDLQDSERLEKLLRLKRELLGVNHKLSELQPRREAYEAGFRLEMAELRVKLDPKLSPTKRAGMLRELDGEKRRDHYTAEGVGAGETREVAARQAAARVNAEDALSIRERQVEAARNPSGVSSLQRIGGGTNLFGGAAGGGGNALLGENQRQTREIQGLRADIGRLLRDRPAASPSSGHSGAIFN